MAGTETDPRTVAATALKCVACGAPYTLRGFSSTKTVACEYCGSILDTSKPEWQLVERVEKARQLTPIWPLGTKAKLWGKRFDLIGWMKRFVEVEGIKYFWEEHLFFNPYYGFRYLIFQNGHFTLVEPLPSIPATAGAAGAATHEDRTYKHFTTGKAVVAEVVGEFPWRVRRGDTVIATDYVSPPYMLSSEQDEEEKYWSRGVYLTPDEVFDCVGPPKRVPPSPRGVFPNQPNPHHSYKAWLPRWTWIALGLWLLLSLVYCGGSQSKRVGAFDVGPKPPATAAGTAEATNSFELELDSSRDPANVEIRASAGVDNSWAFCSCALVNTEAEHAYPFGVEVSYYHGVDGGESWSEGSRDESVHLGGIPNGKYVLQIEREDTFPGPVHVEVWRDVTLVRYPIVSLILILLFPIWIAIRTSSFESKRWAESDHASS